MLDNPRSDRVRRVAALARKKDRLTAGRYLVEGPQAVRELLRCRPDVAHQVYATMGTEPWQSELDRLASDAGVGIERVTEPVLATMCETVTPQGVIAVAEMERPSLGEALTGARLVAILHEVRDPGNAGTVLRAADAAGADAVVFAGESVDPWHPKVVRATTGSLFHLPVVLASDLGEAVDAARSAGIRVIAADLSGDDLAPADPELTDPTAWVFGNEARGLRDSDLELVDRALRLPIYGRSESLNLAGAATVCLYASAFAQRR